MFYFIFDVLSVIVLFIVYVLEEFRSWLLWAEFSESAHSRILQVLIILIRILIILIRIVIILLRILIILMRIVTQQRHKKPPNLWASKLFLLLLLVFLQIWENRFFQDFPKILREIPFNQLLNPCKSWRYREKHWFFFCFSENFQKLSGNVQ